MKNEIERIGDTSSAPAGHLPLKGKALDDEPEVIRGGLNFGHALFWLKGGFPLRRRGWGERWIELRNIYGRDVIGCVYLRHGEPVWMGPFVAAQEDLLAEDWEILA